MSAESRESEPATVPTGPMDPVLITRRNRASQPGLVAIFPRQLGQPPATWLVPDEAILGRAAGTHVRLDDSSVSRRHARLKAMPDGLAIADLGSSHGTFVDGQRVGVDGVLAAWGAVVRAGCTLLLVVKDAQEYAAPISRTAAGTLGLQRDVIAGPTLGKVWQFAARVAARPHPVLVLGESGSGKEAIARIIHAKRERPGPFVALNIAAVPEGMFESELFGHVRGAFTGAATAHMGAFRAAHAGVLFIDEVADLRQDLQVKLLRALDQMCVRPLGSNEDVAVNTRVVAATSQDLQAACARGSFRRDLYYRLSGIVIQVPPLRERRDEITALALAFLEQEETDVRLSVHAAEALTLARWEGNVRELHFALAQASVQALSSGATDILPEHLPQLNRRHPQEPESENRQLGPKVIEAAMAQASGNASLAAKYLGVSRSTFYNLLKRHGIAPTLLRARR